VDDEKKALLFLGRAIVICKTSPKLLPLLLYAEMVKTILAITIIFIGSGSAAWADYADMSLREQGLASMKIESCVSCHENPGLKMAVMRSDGLLHDLYVDSLRFRTSIHYRREKNKCLDCHKEGYDIIPHRAAKSLVCFDCHEDFKAKFLEIQKEAGQSVHFGSTEVRFGCGTCHSPHYMKKAVEMTLAEKNSMCIDCHTDRFNRSNLTLNSRHGWHILAPLHLENTACIACHTKPESDVLGVAFKHKILKKEEATRECDDCHTPDGKMLQYLTDIGEKPKTDMSAEQVFKSFYISGATNLKWLDWVGTGMIALSILGAFGHGLIRVFARKRK
jgi:predicted CXXCH cytochrome family protein